MEFSPNNNSEKQLIVSQNISSIDYVCTPFFCSNAMTDPPNHYNDDLLSIPDGLWDYLMTQTTSEDDSSSDEELDENTSATKSTATGSGSNQTDSSQLLGSELLQDDIASISIASASASPLKMMELSQPTVPRCDDDVDGTIAESQVVQTKRRRELQAESNLMIQCHDNSSLSSCEDDAVIRRRELLEEKLLSLDLQDRDGNDDEKERHGCSSTYNTDDQKDNIEDFETANNDDLETILSNQLDQLSLQEQFRSRREVHGIKSSDDLTRDSETPQFVSDKLRQFDDYIQQRIPPNQKQAYERALDLSPGYVMDRKFRLMFLRSDLYDVPKSSIRMARHFEVKLELFGIDKLTKDITLEDLSDNDIESLKQGSHQLLPVRDHVNRHVVCILPSQIPKTRINPNDREYHSLLRFNWYLAMSILQHDEDAQLNGLVCIYFNIFPSSRNHYFFNDVQFHLNMRKVGIAVPHRVAAFHLVYNDSRIFPFIVFIQFLLFSQQKGRFVTHYCNDDSGNGLDYRRKLYFDLQTYGIPTEALPIDFYPKPTVLLDSHMEWFNQQMLNEQRGRGQLPKTANFLSTRSTCNQVIMVPRRFDVLLGRGSMTSQHTGNLRAFHIVEMNYERYQQAGKFEKTRISEMIVHLIQQSRGRFLKKERLTDRGGRNFSANSPGSTSSWCWIETTTDEAREKISHLFRRLRELKKCQQNQQQTQHKGNLKQLPGKRNLQETTIGPSVVA